MNQLEYFGKVAFRAPLVAVLAFVLAILFLICVEMIGQGLHGKTQSQAATSATPGDVTVQTAIGRYRIFANYPIGGQNAFFFVVTVYLALTGILIRDQAGPALTAGYILLATIFVMIICPLAIPLTNTPGETRISGEIGLAVFRLTVGVAMVVILCVRWSPPWYGKSWWKTQFSLRTLLAVVAAMALLLGALVMVRQNHRAMAEELRHEPVLTPLGDPKIPPGAMGQFQ